MSCSWWCFIIILIANRYLYPPCTMHYAENFKCFVLVSTHSCELGKVLMLLEQFMRSSCLISLSQLRWSLHLQSDSGFTNKPIWLQNCLCSASIYYSIANKYFPTGSQYPLWLPRTPHPNLLLESVHPFFNFLTPPRPQNHPYL